MFIATSRAFLGSSVCFKSSYCISRLIKFVMKKFSVEMLACFPRSCYVMRKTCLSNVIFLGLINASSTIFLKSAVVRVSIVMCVFLMLRILRPSTPILSYSRKTVFRSATGHGLSPHIISTSMSLWHLFCQFIFWCAFRALRSRSDVAEDTTIVPSYIGSRGNSNI